MEKIYRQPEPDAEVIGTEDKVEAGLVARSEAKESVSIAGRFHVECVRDGKVIWVEEFDNIVTTVGKHSILDVYFDRSTALAACRMGLKSVGTAVVADTMASHASWTEPAIYASRPSVVWSPASGGSKATNPPATAFAINSGTNTVVAGVFLLMAGSATIADTTGTLFSAGDFSSTKTVSSADTLNVTYTVGLT